MEELQAKAIVGGIMAVVYVTLWVIGKFRKDG